MFLAHDHSSFLDALCSHVKAAARLHKNELGVQRAVWHSFHWLVRTVLFEVSLSDHSDRVEAVVCGAVQSE